MTPANRRGWRPDTRQAAPTSKVWGEWRGRTPGLSWQWFADGSPRSDHLWGMEGG